MYRWWSVEEVNIVRARAAALVHNWKVGSYGRGPEIGFQNVESEIISRDPEIISTPLNVEISAEQVIVPVEQEALNQSQLSRTLLQQFLLLVVFCLHDQIPKMKKMQPPRTAGRASTHRVDRRRRRRPTPFQMASVQFAEIEQRRLDLEERRLEIDRLREENIAQNRQLQEKIFTESYDPEFVYNADETGLVWKALPKPLWLLKGISAPGHAPGHNPDIGKERVTVLNCANSTGNHKLPLL
ncbi:Jerky protein homolog-like [Eumeta japonica]|uniref:Jerky protein homolog-like n=1 Tax=Eumeta variegata TaxID=151549 RepID=A0A4C1XQW0_EUMVA|nr:Jerky protein homolog-like [Eumeta japonica]